MINVFQLADNDQSIYYLGQIFGNVGVALSGTGPALMSQLFQVFNTIMLVVAVIIVVYVSLVGVMKTAAEGEVLGKGWSTLWVPLRTVLGVAILMPTASGYCAAQVIIMWFVVQGVGAADVVWSTALQYFAAGGGVLSPSPPKPTDITGSADTIWTNIMQNLICQSVVTKFSQNREDAVAQTQVLPYAKGDPIQFNFGNASSTALGASNECGMLILPVDSTTNYIVTYNDTTTNPATTDTKTAAAGEQVSFVKSDGTNSTPITVGPDAPPPSANSGYTVKQSGTGSPGRQEGLLKAYQTALPTLEIISNYYVNQIIEDPNCWTPCDPTNPNSCTYFDKWAAFSNPNDLCFYGPVTTSVPENQKGSTAWKAVYAMAGSNFLSDVTKLFAGEASNYAVNAAMANAQEVSGTSMTTVTAPANTTPPKSLFDFFYKPISNADMQKAQVQGWVYAGGYYYTLAKTSNLAQDSYTSFVNASQITLFTQTGPDFPNSNDTTFSTDPRVLITNYSKYLTTQASTALSASLAASGGSLQVTAGKKGGGPSGALSSATNNIAKMWIRAITPAPGSGSPLAGMQSFGHDLLTAADALVWTFFGVSIIASIAAANIILPFGVSVNPFYAAVYQGISMLTTALFFLIAYMITIGGFLGVYAPLIPFILFSLGVITWMVVVVEAMVAGPIIAIGLLSPGGQHEIFSKAEPAIMLTLNLMLRPTLMLFGLFAAMLLSAVAVGFINSAFYNVLSAITGGTVPGMFELLIYIVAYAGLVIVVLNKCFELIHQVPDRVLHWIGHQAAGSGDQQALEAIKGKVSAGGEASAGGAKGVGGAVSGQAQDKAKKHAEGDIGTAAKQEELGNREAKASMESGQIKEAKAEAKAKAAKAAEEKKDNP